MNTHVGLHGDEVRWEPHKAAEMILPVLPGDAEPPVRSLVLLLEVTLPRILWEWPCWIAFGPLCYERAPPSVWPSYAGVWGGGGGGGGVGGVGVGDDVS